MSSGPSVRVREARPDEYEALGRLTVAAYAALLGELMTDGYAAELGDVAGRSGTAVILVAVGPDGSLLGGITYMRGPSGPSERGAQGPTGPARRGPGGGEVILRMLAVGPEAQARGVGTALLQGCIDRARAEGRARILLHTTRWMPTAIHIYERLGFRRAPKRDARVPEVRLLAYELDLTPGRSSEP